MRASSYPRRETLKFCSGFAFLASPAGPNFAHRTNQMISLAVHNVGCSSPCSASAGLRPPFCFTLCPVPRCRVSCVASLVFRCRERDRRLHPLPTPLSAGAPSAASSLLVCPSLVFRNNTSAIAAYSSVARASLWCCSRPPLSAEREVAIACKRNEGRHNAGGQRRTTREGTVAATSERQRATTMDTIEAHRRWLACVQTERPRATRPLQTMTDTHMRTTNADALASSSSHAAPTVAAASVSTATIDAEGWMDDGSTEPSFSEQPADATAPQAAATLAANLEVNPSPSPVLSKRQKRQKRVLAQQQKEGAKRAATAVTSSFDGAPASSSSASAAASAPATSSDPSLLHLLPMRCNQMDGSAPLAAELLPNLLWVGGLSDAQNKNRLRKLGVKLVINVAGELQNAHPRFFEYAKYALRDSEDESRLNTALLHSIADRIQSSLEASKPVLVHCAAGVSRSVAVVMAFIIKHGHKHRSSLETHMTFEDSAAAAETAAASSQTAPSATPSLPSYQSVYNFVQSRRLLACPNEHFVRVLKQFRSEIASGVQKPSPGQLHADADFITHTMAGTDRPKQTQPTAAAPSSAALTASKQAKPLPGKASAVAAASSPAAASADSDAAATDPDALLDPSAPLNAASQFVVLCESQAKDWAERQIAVPQSAEGLAEAQVAAGQGVSDSCRPLVSVCIPCHNAAAFLGATLVSLLHQTHRPLEVCLFDDRSSDDSVRVAESFVGLFKARGITMHIARSQRAQAAGAGFARNEAMKLASGTYFALQDADDLSMPRRIELQLARCESVQQSLASASKDDPARVLNPQSLVLVGCTLQRLPLNATPRWTRWVNSLSSAQLLTHAFREITLPCPTWFMPAATARDLGGFPEVLAEDMQFFYAAITKGCRLERVQGTAEASPADGAAAGEATAPQLPVAQPLLIYRNHASNLSGRTPFAYLHSMRVAALVSLVLESPAYPHFSAPGATFSIWNAGKAGKRFYRALSPALRLRVREFCDIDPQKIARGVFEAHEPGQREPARRVPIVSWESVHSPCIICVRQELEEDESQREFKRRLEIVKGWTEGQDYFFLS